MPSSPPTEAGTLGLIAGGGALPAAILAALAAQGRSSFTVAITGNCDPATVVGQPHVWRDIAAVGGILAALRDAGCVEVLLAGRMSRPDFSALLPDWQGLKLLPRVIKAATRGDDALIRTLVEYFEEQGFRIVGTDAVASALVAPSGVLGAVRPAEADLADIVRAAAVVQALGALDVGQAAVVRDGLVLGVEAAEGTDALLARCATLNGPQRGGVLVKAVKPGQERRVDLPTIGVATVQNAAAARLAGIAIQAGSALILDRVALGAAADAAGMFVVGVEA